MKLKQAKVKNGSISFSWEKVPGATSYEIYASRCNYNGKEISLKKIDTVKKTSYKWKGLKPGTMYKIRVKAKGGDKVIAKGVLIHVATAGSVLKNPKSVTVNKTKVKLKKKETFKLSASFKADGPVDIHRKICYSSSNPDIATVDKNGLIKAKRKGKCSVYAYAQNGVYKEVKVTVG